MSILPVGARIVELKSFRPGYLHYPLEVTVRTPDGDHRRYVVKRAVDAGRIEREARTLTALAELDIPVPVVLAGPVNANGRAEHGALLILSRLPGDPLPWLGLTSLGQADRTCRLLIDGVTRLHALTAHVRTDPMAATLPEYTLLAELDGIVAQAGRWLQHAAFAEAVQRLRVALPHITADLVFSNGDYNPLNFLHVQEQLTGLVDFESACFEDPHIGFAKFLIWSGDHYGWGAGRKAGLVERYLYARNVSRHEFEPRLLLRCLRHLVEEVSMGARRTPPYAITSSGS